MPHFDSVAVAKEVRGIAMLSIHSTPNLNLQTSSTSYLESNFCEMCRRGIVAFRKGPKPAVFRNIKIEQVIEVSLIHILALRYSKFEV